MTYSISEAIEFGIKELRGKERPRLETEILLSYIMDVERVYLHTHSHRYLSQKQSREFRSLIARAKNHEPIEYLTQKVNFYGYEWKIIKGVLVPRPETEILIDQVSELIVKYNIKKVFELGVGSGIISITLALLHPEIEVVGSDINPLAIWLSQENLKIFGAKYDITLGNRVKFMEIDIFKEPIFSRSFDLFVSNPPYIALDYPLPPNVRYEPKEALFGGEGGEEMLYALVDIAKNWGIQFLACEMGWDQKEKMRKKLQDCKSVEFFHDLSGLDRGFVAIL